MARVWTCRRVSGGQRCGHLNPGRKRNCESCGLPRPALSRPKHMAALDQSYESYVEINGGDACGVCGKPRGDRRLNRDHDHKAGVPRGLACPGCNRNLPSWVDPDWLWSAWRYLVRCELREAGRLIWKEEDRGHGTPCWVWQRALHSAGYGVIRYQGELLYVHRIMLPGPIPPGWQVDHLCRVKACVNPAHLEAVPRAENVRRGEATKLTLADVRQIRARRLAGETTVALGAEYGVDPGWISRIAHGLVWREETAENPLPD